MCTRVLPADTYSIHVLQPHNSETLCEAVIQVARSHAPNLVEDATAIARKFQQAFNLFSRCHLVYDSAKLLEDTVINELGNHKHQHVYTCNTDSCFLTEINIESFLNYYRDTFPAATVTPKLHMLEDHVVPFLRRWRVGFGFHGEQGAESLHAAFNKISRSYLAIPDRVQRLKCVLKEHHLQISPTLVAQEPPVKKRKSI